MWQCPKCKREFEKRNQQHSCVVYPVEKHLKGKEKIAKPLYGELKNVIKKNIGAFKIESLPCCIHFVKASNAYTFAAVYALKNKIRIHFGLNHEMKSPRIDKFAKTSANKYMYSLDIKSASEIDRELISWLKQAYNLKGK